MENENMTPMPQGSGSSKMLVLLVLLTLLGVLGLGVLMLSIQTQVGQNADSIMELKSDMKPPGQDAPPPKNDEDTSDLMEIDVPEAGVGLMIPKIFKKATLIDDAYASYDFSGEHDLIANGAQIDSYTDYMLVSILDNPDVSDGWKAQNKTTIIGGQTADIYDYNGPAEFSGNLYLFAHNGKKVGIHLEAHRRYVPKSDGLDVGDTQALADKEAIEYDKIIADILDSVELY